MTELEKKAEEYRKLKKQEIIDNDDFEKLDRFDENVEEAYIAGAKENGVEWHDLIKDPDDLPEDSHTVQDQDGTRFYYFRGHFYYENDDFSYNCKPSYWCEIPQFKE